MALRSGRSQEVTIWQSVNVTLDASLRELLAERRINAVQFHPPEAIADDDFIARFEPSVPTFMKSFADFPLDYVTRPHLVFDMDDLLHCVEFFELLGVDFLRPGNDPEEE